MGEDSPTDYVVIHEFLRGIYESLTVGEAFRRGLIDELLDAPLPASEPDHLLRFFLSVLEANGVVEQRDGHYALTERFGEALRFRHLMEAQIKYSTMLVRDLAFDTSAVFALGEVAEHAIHEPATETSPDGPIGDEYLRLYQFDLHDSENPWDQAATEAWVDYMNTLSRYEAPVVCSKYDFSAHRRMLDIGGNTGQFACTVCEHAPDLHAAVFDLPGVVAIGRRTLAGRPGFDRVEYVGGDAFADELPRGCDLVTFKSTLHDWPDDKAAELLEAAWSALEPGGTLLVFERSRVDLKDYQPVPFSLLTLLGWAWTLRGPERYEAVLRRLGAEDLQLEEFHLDLPWMVLTATKPAG
ncbi:MAG: class I SAM-dependent methyltransferase [Acidimicrobiales bacterium]|nr:class I SAM-dependent methyltransferase [Acidimicrobiales bacterium]MCB9373948.1 class I SAM-dependent methyltransferase [Microthrixaceae bacterium]